MTCSSRLKLDPHGGDEIKNDAPRMNKAMHESSEALMTAPEILERLNRARRFIDLCYDLPLDLEEISSHACFSRYHFLRLFRQAFNKTPHQYLIERRIERAKELLSANDLRVTDVCFEVGFQSLGSFSSLFHKSVGHAPIAFREKSRQTQAAKRQVPGCFLVMYKLESA
jgi:AraC-like DNA-binding protein